MAAELISFTLVNVWASSDCGVLHVYSIAAMRSLRAHSTHSQVKNYLKPTTQVIIKGSSLKKQKKQNIQYNYCESTSLKFDHLPC